MNSLEAFAGPLVFAYFAVALMATVMTRGDSE